MEIRTLYNKNTPLLDVGMEKGVIVAIDKVYEENEKFFPICFYNDLSPKTVNSWFQKRNIPATREGIKEIQRKRIKINYGGYFSLSDQYWLKKQNSRLTWEIGNYFTNDYFQEYGKLFFTPWSVNTEKLKKPSPDLTTNGVLKKTWIQENGISYLYKAGSEKYKQEPTSEVLASIILSQLNIIDFVNYELVIYGLKFCSKCKNFVTENTEFIPASHFYYLVPEKKEESVIDHMERACELFQISGIRDYMLKMIGVDVILGNDDRHLGNFGFVRNVETGTIEGFSPLFDFGSAYSFFENSKKQKNYFKKDKKEAYKKVKNLIENKNINTKEMYRLVKVYPNFNENERDIIRFKIKQTENKLEKEVYR